MINTKRNVIKLSSCLILLSLNLIGMQPNNDNSKEQIAVEALIDLEPTIRAATKEKVKRIMLYGNYNPYSVTSYKKTNTQPSKKTKSRNTGEDEDFKKPEPIKRISRDLINLLKN